MATIVELTASVQALGENLSATITDLSAKVSALEGEVDPAQLDPVKASIDSLAELAKSADPGPAAGSDVAPAESGAPAAEAPAPEAAAVTLYATTLDPNTVDLTVWAKADALTTDGHQLYIFSGPAVPDPLPPEWSVYTGVPQPVPTG